MVRIDNRNLDQLRPVRITLGYQSYAEGSVLIELGRTSVLCSVTMEERVPAFLKGSGEGWVTAEYSMLPRSTVTRTPRERKSGRAEEIQRLIGRSLRAATDLTAFGERQLIVDCDVIQADGGTRTAAITGAYVALYQAFQNLKKSGLLRVNPLTKMIAATSVGIVDGEYLLDLCYEEDFRAQVDFNVVMTDHQEFVEIQGTAEHRPFTKVDSDGLLALAQVGIERLFKLQHQALRDLA
ncbi:MAG: ribonuclease PH [Dehalococcoidia bacterium]|nr:ribonuclease PH [Dehalococcoidia bacterium]